MKKLLIEKKQMKAATYRYIIVIVLNLGISPFGLQNAYSQEDTVITSHTKTRSSVNRYQFRSFGLVRAMHRDFATSPLKVKVEAGKANNFTIELDRPGQK